MTELFGDHMTEAIDDAAGHVNRAQDMLIAFLSNPSSLLAAISVMGAVLQQLAQARAALAAAERIRLEASPRRRAALQREAARRNGNGNIE